MHICQKLSDVDTFARKETIFVHIKVRPGLATPTPPHPAAVPVPIAAALVVVVVLVLAFWVPPS
jgi:hypothetical protein